MAEVSSQLSPLKITVERLDKTVRSLYRNGDEGAPGFLQTAREEDLEKWTQTFKKLDRLRPLEDFVLTFKATEKQREDDRLADAKALAEKVAQSERSFKRWVGVAGLILSLVGVVLHFWK